MTAGVRRGAWVAAGRAVNALFFLVTATYCILTYSSFAYQQFIRPRLVAALSGFVVFHHLWHWVFLGVTVATLLSEWRTTRGRIVAWTYVGAMALVGLLIIYRPILPSVENDSLGLWLACGFLVPTIWLALYDHIATAAEFNPERVDTRRLLMTAVAAAGAVWAMSAVSVPLRLDGLGEYTVTRAGLLFGAFVSLGVHVALFAAFALVLALLLTAVRRSGGSAYVEYWTIASVACASAVFTMKGLVFGGLSFTGAAAWLLAVEVALALTLTWSAMAHRLGSAGGRPTAIEAWLAPVPGTASVATALIGVVLLPVAAAVALRRVERFDWNFLVQNLCVLVAWLVACALVHTATRRMTIASARRPVALGGAVMLAIGGIGAAGRVDRDVAARAASRPFVTEFVLDAYATVDPSYRLMRHLLTFQRPGEREFFAYLGANTLIQHQDVQPVDVDFVKPLAPVQDPPHIFLFVVDSLRRDYLSPYNPHVTFTPSMDAFAKENYAFQRAFTAYGGTGLSMPALWAGSMVFHKEYVLPFQRMNALEKLLTVNGYRPVMGMDHITAQIVSPTMKVDELDKGRDELDYDFCSTVDELESKLDTGIATRQPIFAHTRSLTLHISQTTKRVGSPDPAYGGFQPAAAMLVQRIDGCFGKFISYLRDHHLYDHSIVILTADHGDALGESNRWGHTYTMFPEIVRIPLLVHVPPQLRDRFTTDLDALSLTTDITPSLYTLLGYTFDAPKWPLGRSLFVPPGTDTSWRRRDPAVLVSSYGPVYSVLRNNGDQLYIADGVNERDYAYDLSGLKPIRIGVTSGMREADRGLIRERVAQLSAIYHFSPAH